MTVSADEGKKPLARVDPVLRLCVVEFNSQGGLIHYAYQLCTAMARQQVEVTLVTATAYELAAFPHNFTVVPLLRRWPVFDAASMNDQTASLPRRKWRRVLWELRRIGRAVRLIREWRRLLRYLVEQRPDIVQFGEIVFPFEAVFLARLKKKGIRLAQICHEFERREDNTSMGAMLDRWGAGVFRNFSVIFFLAQDTRQRFLALFPFPADSTFVIPHGNEQIFLEGAAASGAREDLHRRYHLGPGENIVLFFGLLSASKGLPDLVEAFAVVSAQVEAKLIIAGFPTKKFDLPGLKKNIADLGLERRVILDPRYIPIADVASLFSLASVVVLPYRNGTQSGVLQTAYTFGRPVVATSVGGLAEVVEEGKSGFLVPPGAPDQLAEKMQLLLQQPALARQMGSYGRELAEARFGWAPIARRITRVYRDVLCDPQQRAERPKMDKEWESSL